LLSLSINVYAGAQARALNTSVIELAALLTILLIMF